MTSCRVDSDAQSSLCCSGLLRSHSGYSHGLGEAAALADAGVHIYTPLCTVQETFIRKILQLNLTKNRDLIPNQILFSFFRSLYSRMSCFVLFFFIIVLPNLGVGFHMYETCCIIYLCGRRRLGCICVATSSFRSFKSARRQWHSSFFLFVHLVGGSLSIEVCTGGCGTGNQLLATPIGSSPLP